MPVSRFLSLLETTPIDGHRLHIFCMVAESGSIAEAARQMNLTRSALSHALRTLEDDLECVLFQRTEKSLCISEAGRQLLPFAQRILQVMNEARASLRAAL